MQPGSFVRISKDTLGYAGNLGIGAITSVDINNCKKQRSVCFIAGTNFSSIVFSPRNLQIDIEELNPFISALTKMKEAVDSRNLSGLQTYQYTSSNLTVLSMENRIGNQAKWDITIYKRYKYLNEMVNGSVFSLKGRDIGELRDVLIRYRDSLQGNLYD